MSIERTKSERWFQFQKDEETGEVKPVEIHPTEEEIEEAYEQGMVLFD